MQSAGVPTSLEPNCSRVSGSNPVTSAGDRADILCDLQDRLLLSDVSVTHCCADTYVGQAAANAGSTAEARAAKKVTKHALRAPGGYDFTPLVVESYGRQCSATHKILNLLGRQVSGGLPAVEPHFWTQLIQKWGSPIVGHPHLSLIHI